MKSICFNHRGSTGGGGPVTFIYKTAAELQKRGYRVSYDKPQNSDAAICIIETGKFRKYCKNSKTRLVLRIDGIYDSEYNKKFNRAIRPDMAALHAKLNDDIPNVHHVAYQSNWSKLRIDDQIVKRTDNNWSIIHNGVNTNLFVPATQKPKRVNLIHVGMMRDSYLMEMIMGTYNLCRKEAGLNVGLILAGNMDAGCKKVFNQHKSDPNIKYLGHAKNTKLAPIYQQGSIFVGARQGSSSDNVIAEAQACGVVPVIPKWGGNVDMVVDGFSGRIVESGRWDYDDNYIKNLTGGVVDIVNNLEEYQKNAREHAVKELGIEKMVDKYLKALGI